MTARVVTRLNIVTPYPTKEKTKLPAQDRQ